MSLTCDVRSSLSDWISFLLPSISSRSHRTFIELLFGAMLSPEGWVTRAISAISRGAHWGTYYKLIERAQIDIVALARRTVQLILRIFPQEIATLIIDDTLVPRGSTAAAGSKIRFDHAQKPNRPRFIQCQCWVTLALVLRVRLGSALTVPLRSWLITETGQRGKLYVARQLLHSLQGQFKRVRLLIDSWYMRRSLIAPLLQEGVQVIGQVRHDTVLYLPPVEPKGKRRGRPRKYGDRLTPARVRHLPVHEITVELYGKEQPVRLRTAVALARFLKGVKVRAVWCEMQNKHGEWTTARLVLATEADLTDEAVIVAYGQRWGIEPLFHNLKRWWGCDRLWQHSKEALELWMQIRSTAYTLTQLLALTLFKSFPLLQIAPWRKGAVITAGLFATWMRHQFWGLRLRDAYHPKSRKFNMPEPAPHPLL